MKIKKIFEKYDGIFDELIKNAEKTRKKEVGEQETLIKHLKKKIKKIEKFLIAKLKYFDVQNVIIKTDSTAEKIAFSKEKGFFLLNGTHKNFALRQCLGLFKNQMGYMNTAQYVVNNAESIFETVLKAIKHK